MTTTRSGKKRRKKKSKQTEVPQREYLLDEEQPVSRDDIQVLLRQGVDEEKLERLLNRALAKAAPHDLGVHGEYIHGIRPSAHQKIWVEYLEKFFTREIRHLLIVAPPGHGKTNWLQAFCSWALAKDPDLHLVYTSSASQQANKPSVAVRDIIKHSPRFHECYPDISPDTDKGWSEKEWFLRRKDIGDKDPSFIAAGVDVEFLGARCDILLLDDVCTQKNMSTEYQRLKVQEWIRKTARTRIRPKGGIISIMTRWHEDDVMSYLQGLPGAVVVHMPALGYWEKEQGIDLADYTEGSALWEEEWSKELLLEIRGNNDNSIRDFELMYQGYPYVQEGAIFKDSWWGTYHNPPQKFDFVFQFWDTAYKEKQRNDYSVCLTWGIANNAMYLLDVWRDKVSFPRLEKAVRDLYREYKPYIVLVEDKASGTSLTQTLSSSTMIPIVPFPVDNAGKEARAHASTGLIQSGKVLLPAEASWKSTFLKEHRGFPDAKYDDQVDCTSGSIVWVQTQDIIQEDEPVLDTTVEYGSVIPDVDDYESSALVGVAAPGMLSPGMEEMDLLFGGF